MRHIVNRFGDILYCIRDDGTITDVHNCNILAHFRSDRITDKFDISILYRIREDGTVTDKFDCDVVAYIRDDGTIMDKNNCDVIAYIRDGVTVEPDDDMPGCLKDDKIQDMSDVDMQYRSRQGSTDAGTHQGGHTPDSSGDSSDLGCIGVVFSFIGHLLLGILKLIFYIYKFIFQYLFITIFATVTVFYFVIFIVSAVAGILPNIALVLGVFGAVMVAISLPYWVILFIQKHKRKMKWKETIKYHGKWFIKGPFAYKDIIELKNRPVE